MRSKEWTIEIQAADGGQWRTVGTERETDRGRLELANDVARSAARLVRAAIQRHETDDHGDPVGEAFKRIYWPAADEIGEAEWRVAVWMYADADTSTEPDAIASAES